jgi:hypothetical protein
MEYAISRRWRPLAPFKVNYLAIEKFQQPRRHKPSLNPLVLMNKIKVTVKVEHVMNAQSGCKGIALLFL